MLDLGQKIGIESAVALFALLAIAVLAVTFYFLPWYKSGIRNVNLLTTRYRLSIGRRLFIESIYSAFRFGAQNKPIVFGTIVLTVVVGGLQIGLVGDNQTFSFVYATLLFFQILILQNTHLLRLGKNRKDEDADEDSSKDWRTQELWNAGTAHAQNVRITYSVYNGDGRPLRTGHEIELGPEDRSLAPGDALSEDVSLGYDPAELGVDEDKQHHLRVVAKTGEGVSLLTDAKWVTLG